MDFSSPYYSDEPSNCIDPKVLVYGAGEGFNEPCYPFPTFVGEDAIDLYHMGEQSLKTRDNVEAYPDWASDEDADHESIDESPLIRRSSTLDPKAPAFVPARQMETVGIVPSPPDEGLQLEALHPVESPPTPRIEVSCPNDAPFERVARASEGVKSKNRPQSRQPSPRGRSPSISRPRKQSKGRKTSPIPKAVASKLITALEVLPVNRAVPYNVGDRTAPLAGLHLHASYPPPMPLDPQLHPTMPGLATGLAQRGYACSHEGCPESDRHWDTRSDRDHHQRKHVPADQRAHACEHCGRTFHFPKDLNRHMVVHDGSKVICPVCDKPYSRNDNLKRHIKSQHGRAASMGSASQMSVPSPTPSLVTSFTQSPIDDTGHNTPWNLSPLAAKSTPWSKNAHTRHDSVNGSAREVHSQPESPLSAQPMSKSFSNRS